MPKRVLIVDDEAFNRILLSDQLKAWGYEVISANDGLEGLEKARTLNPDLMILDCMMPKLEGPEVCRLLKFDDNFNHIPIIMLTARTQEIDKNIGDKVRADEYVGKPYVADDLHNKIMKYLGE